MIGRARMRNIRACVERVIAEDVRGDLIETGVWRGGAAIYMRGILAAHGVGDREVWVADSFAGLPHDVIAKMVGLNGVRAYGLDQKELQQVANRICAPTVEEVADPLSEVEVPEHHGLFSFRTVGPWA